MSRVHPPVSSSAIDPTGEWAAARIASATSMACAKLRTVAVLAVSTHLGVADPRVSRSVAFHQQVRQRPETLQQRECGLIEVGRQHTLNFGAGHAPSGSGVQRVLTELRTLAAERPWLVRR
ncbi:MAG: hypothetical protein ACRDTH_28510 [Pseudonocardiaceae bacterium]